MEDSSNNGIYEKYFPSSQSRNQPENLGQNSITCCLARPVHHCCLPPSCSVHQCHSPAGESDIAKAVDKLASKVLLIAGEISDIKSTIKYSNCPSSSNTVPSSSSSTDGSRSSQVTEQNPGPAQLPGNVVPSPGLPASHKNPNISSDKPPLSPDIMVIETINSHSSPDNMSYSFESNTIDDNVPSEPANDSLNSPLLTIQPNY